MKFILFRLKKLRKLLRDDNLYLAKEFLEEIIQEIEEMISA